MDVALSNIPTKVLDFSVKEITNLILKRSIITWSLSQGRQEK